MTASQKTPNPGAKPEHEVHLWNYVWVVQKRRWLVSACVGAAVLLVLVSGIGKKPRYSATVQVQIDPERVRESLQRVEAATSATYDDRAYMETQFELLSSVPLCDEVCRELRLDTLPEFTSSKPDSVVGYVFKWIGDLLHVFDPAASSPEQVERAKRDNMLRRFEGRLSVDQVKGSRLVAISFWSHDPKLAADIANAIAKKHIELDLKRRLGALEDVYRYLEKQQGDFRKRVEESERAFEEYRRKYDIVGLEDKKNIIGAKLEQLNLDLLNAENRMRQAEAAYNKLVELERENKNLETVPEIADNQAIQKLKADYLALLLQKEDLSKKFGPKHPKMAGVIAQIAVHKEKLDNELRIAREALKHKYENAKTEVESLKGALERQKQMEKDLAEKGIEYKVLQRDVESNQEIFQEVLRLSKQSASGIDFHGSNIRVVVDAEIPTKPMSAHRIRNLLMGVVFGLGLGVGLAFFIEYLDNSIRTIEDIEEYIMLPLLGPVSAMERKGEGEDDGAAALPTRGDPESQAAENFRTIRTNVIFSTAEQSQKVLLVTSSIPQEGKTTVASNLAVVFAQAGKKTLLVDADMRRPDVHRLFDLDNSTGLSSILAGHADVASAAQRSGVENLDVITAGPIPPNQTELLGSPAMEALLKAAGEKYEIILFDSPPVGSVSDGIILSKYVGGVVAVVACGRASRWVVRRSIQQLRDVNAKLLGVVLNNVDMLRDGYARYHYYRYYSYYTEDGKKRKRRSEKAAKEA